METQTDPSRTRTYSWSDPPSHADQIGKLSGLETAAGDGRGQLPSPPIMHTLGMAGIDVEEGESLSPCGRRSSTTTRSALCMVE